MLVLVVFSDITVHSKQAAVRPGSGPAESCSFKLRSSSAATAAPTADQSAPTAIPGSEDKVGTYLPFIAIPLHFYVTP